MLPYLTNFFKKGKIPSRDPSGKQKNKPYYLKKLPIYIRYPRLFYYGGLSVVFCTFFSAPIYYNLFVDPATVDPKSTWWRHEIINGKTDVQIARERKAANPNITVREMFRPYDRHADRKKAHQALAAAALAAGESNAQ